MSENKINYYKILEIDKSSSQKEIASVYRKLSLKWHPDKPTPLGYTKEQQTSKFQEITQAYEVLSNEEKRKEYDLGKQGNGVGLNDWWKNKANSMLGESIEKLKELFIAYGATEKDLDPQLWAPFATWEDKAWALHEQKNNQHHDFLELLREESQKAGKRKKFGSPKDSPVENIPKQKEIPNKKESENPQIPYHNEEIPPENPTDEDVKIEVKMVNDNVNNKSSSEDELVKQNNKKMVINLGNIKKITLTSKGELVIEFNESNEVALVSQIITSEQINSSQELQKAKSYLKSQNKTSINQAEFSKLISGGATSAEKSPKDNNALLIGGGITILVIGLVAGILISKKKTKKTK